MTSSDRALKLLKSIYDHTRENGTPVFVGEVAGESGLTAEEAQASWRYLRDKGLIRTYNLDYTASVNQRGIDEIEGSADPRRNSAMPSAIYNTVNIGTMTNSHVQQAGAGTSQSQSVTYNADKQENVVRLLELLTTRLDELCLSEKDTRRVKAQLDALEAELSSDPDPALLKQTIGTIGSLVSEAVDALVNSPQAPGVWAWVASVLPSLSS